MGLYFAGHICLSNSNNATLFLIPTIRLLTKIVTNIQNLKITGNGKFSLAGGGYVLKIRSDCRSYINMSRNPRYDFDLRKIKWNFFNEGVEFGYRYQRDTLNKSYIHRMKGQYNRNGMRDPFSMN